jgi:aspartate kinase
MVVLKFGGTSVADVDALARLVAIVRRESRPRVVVVSALARATDALIDIARAAADGHHVSADRRLAALVRRHLDMAGHVGDARRRARLSAAIRKRALDLRTLVRTAALVRGVSPALLDAIVAHGELMSSRIVADALEDAGTPAAWIDARQAIVTGGEHGAAQPDFDATAGRLRAIVQPRVAQGEVVVFGGFIGATPAGVTTTLGRGGSDYSASIVGACLDAGEIQIWTDVDGMLTADPRVLGGVRLVSRLSFAEASELARFGAKVLHPATIQPAVDRDIPVRILNSRRPLGAGTWIRRTAPIGRPAAAIASLPGISLLDVQSRTPSRPGVFLAHVFAVFDHLGIDPHVVTCGDGRVSAAVRSGEQAGALVSALDAIARVTVTSDMALVCVVGEQLARDEAAVATMLDAIDGVPIRMMSRAVAGLHLVLAVPASLMRTAVARLHDRLFGLEQDADMASDSAEGTTGMAMPVGMAPMAMPGGASG